MEFAVECSAIVISGNRAGKKCKRLTTVGKCKIHLDSLLKHGAYNTELREAEAVHQRILRDNNEKFTGYELIGQNEIAFDNYMKRIDNAAILNDNIDHIAAWMQRRKQAKWNRRMEQLRQENRLRLLAHVADNPNNNIAAFVNDNQNVHTQIIVKQTSDIIAIIRKNIVPPEYQWNNTKCSKTPADIITLCELSPDAAFQMMSKYCSAETIYDLEEGIYGKTLDSVWQFILKSDDKDSLIQILKQEMEDNVGMCTQGNLSRLCNIVAGYMEGIRLEESPAEILGREFPRIREIENEEERLNEAKKLLAETTLPPSQWDDWLAAL